MKPRSERRRDDREGKEPRPSRWPINAWASAFLIAGVVVIAVGGVLLLTGGSDSEDGAPTPAPTDTLLIDPVTPDEIALEAIARRTIEALPSGEWPELYAEFTAEFQERCSFEEFTAVGAEAAVEQGPNLALIRYVGIQSFAVQPTEARVIIVGELVDQLQYITGTDFEKVDGVWRIAPVEGSVGCESFDRLSG